MGIKFLVPIVGLGGTIASVVGVSTSNQRSEKPAEKVAIHKWNIEVEKEISIELTCNPENTGRTNGNYSLKFSFELEGTEKNELMKKEVVTKTSDVIFKAESDWEEIRDFTTSDGEVEMSIRGKEDKGGITVELNKKGERNGGSGTKTFNCKNGVLVKGVVGAENEIWKGSVSPNGNRSLNHDRDEGLRFSAKIGKCLVDNGDNGSKCDLKVTTANSLDWSTIVNKKVKFTIS